MGEIKLRPYQESLIAEARDKMSKGQKSLLITSPTGSGKTILTAFMLRTAAEKGIPSIFLVHRKELVKQSMLAFDSLGIRHGVIASGFEPDPYPLVQIGSIGTYKNRIKKFRTPKLVIFDEAHHCAAATWAYIYNSLPDAYKVGVTASPIRLDCKGLDDYFSGMIHGPSVRWLIDNGYLCDYKMYAPSGPSLSGVKSRMGDYIKSDLMRIMDKPTITGSAIGEYKKRASGKRALVFAVSIEHSKHIVDQFNAVGISAEHIDGNSSSEHRAAALDRFRRGETLVISSVNLFIEGLDIHLIECVIMLRPTQSLGMYIQMVGRGLRTHEGKENLIILDHANNAATHGLPDEDRDWSLKGIERKKKDSDAGPSIKICESCFAAQMPGVSVCRFCGYSFPLKPRVVDEVEGTLVEIDQAALRKTRRTEQGMAKSKNELYELAVQRKYKNPRGWAHIMFQARQKKKLGG